MSATDRIAWTRVTVLMLVGFLLACGGQSAQESAVQLAMEEQKASATPWSGLDLQNDPDRFQFAIVSDNTGRARAGVFENAIAKLNLLQPEFVMSVGDLIQGNTEDLREIEQQWERFDGWIDRLEMPFFYVPGNHGYSNPVMADVWEKRLGRPYYRFVYRDFLFLCLNSEEDIHNRPRMKILDEQYDFVETALAEDRDVRWTMVFLHKPLWKIEDTGRWGDVEKLLAKRRHTVFAGHLHHYFWDERNNGQYFVLATTGAKSELRGHEYGEFDHVVWVTMSETGPIVANLSLDGVRGEDARATGE